MGMSHWSCGSMKGFIYLLEIAVASILIVVVLSTFFAIRVKQDWDSSDLIGVGNNMLNYIRQNDSIVLNVLDEDFMQIEKIKPVNIGYGLRVMGSPKTNIIVGCAQPSLCADIDDMLTDAYVNGRLIEFHIEPFDIDSGIPEFIDAVVLVNYTDYSTHKLAIENYLNKGGIVIGINATYNNIDIETDSFNNIFGLEETSSSSGISRFEEYDPETEDLEKYFLGIGFYVGTEWHIWEDVWLVNYVGDHVNITLPDRSDYRYRGEGDTFDLPGPGGTYSFKVNKIWPSQSMANIQPLDTDFAFEDFSDPSDVIELNKKLVGTESTASMTSNGSAIWMSDFPMSHEYISLVKSAIISRKDEWVAKGVFTTKETTTVSSFFSLCCDMPETSELEITLWYSI
jgi:hypothetical protein